MSGTQECLMCMYRRDPDIFLRTRSVLNEADPNPTVPNSSQQKFPSLASTLFQSCAPVCVGVHCVVTQAITVNKWNTLSLRNCPVHVHPFSFMTHLWPTQQTKIKMNREQYDQWAIKKSICSSHDGLCYMSGHIAVLNDTTQPLGPTIDWGQTEMHTTRTL